MNENQTFVEWIAATEKQRSKLMAYGKTGTPATEEGRAIDSLTAIEMTDEAARLRAEAEKHLSHERELAMWAVKKDHPELTSREREIVERSAVREMQLMVDSCEITYKSCLSRYFNYRGS